MNLSARLVESHLSLALIRCAAAQLQVHGVGDDGRTQCDSWQADRILVQVKVPLSEDTARAMASALELAGVEDVTVASVQAQVQVNMMMMRSREMTQVSGYVTDSCDLSRIRFEFTDSELEAADANWRKRRQADDREIVASLDKPTAVCENCGTTYIVLSGSVGRFCSQDCCNESRRTQGVRKRNPKMPKEERTCYCGQTFLVSRYAPTRTCSSGCAMRMRAATMRERRARQERTT